MIYEFGTFRVDTERVELTAEGEAIAVQPQVFALLAFLIENHERVVAKDEVIERVWSGRAISDSTLNARVNALRRALGDSGEAQAVIRTVPRRGYRFVAPLSGGVSNREKPAEPHPPPDQSGGRTSIAVLPFTNLSGDPEQTYFIDGIAEDLITTLSHFKQFFVIARHSTSSFSGTDQDVKDIASRLGAQFLLQGSFRKSGKNIRIAVQLIDGKGGNTVWAERYDRMLEDVFAIQDDVTTMIVGAVQPEVSRAEQERARRHMTGDISARDLFYRGIWHCWRTAPQHLDTAQRLFRESIARDPGFAAPHAYLAFTIWRTVVFRYEPRQALDAAYDAARSALEIDDTDAHAHWAMGVVHLQKRDHDLARAELERAIALNPSLASAYHWLGWTLVYDGRPEEGIDAVRIAQRLSPNDPAGWGMTLIEAQACINTRRFADAEALAERVRHRVNTLPVNYVLLAARGHLGTNADRSELIEAIRSVDQQFGPESIVDVFPFNRQADIDTWIAGLRLAGL